MSLSSSQLDAFLAISRTASFSKAADLVHVTQSALSQKIKILEEELGITLFKRTPSGVLLTEQGERLLRYCQAKDSMEEELLKDLSISKDKTLSGTLRVACYSTVFRSVIIPSLAKMLKDNPKIQVEFICGKMPELPEKLQRAETDFLIMDFLMEKSNIQAEKLGREKYVVIESKKNKTRDVFLDNDADDLATEKFLKSQSSNLPKYYRSYFDDCYGIIDAVEQGLGRAVMPEHLVRDNASLLIVGGFKPVYFDVVLHYYKQPFYSRLHQTLIDTLKRESPKYLD